MPDWSEEIAAGMAQGRRICGIDEVGRGPLAGPVLACALILDSRSLPASLRQRLDDSKALSAKTRREIAALLPDYADFAIGQAEVGEIDRLNIRRATHLAMARAIAGLNPAPDFALIDGNDPPDLPCLARTLVKGDRRSLSIAAASIIAKVARDKIMRELAATYSTYGWERNAGYGTAEHLAAIRRHGITPEHRRTFRPISELYPLTN